MHHNLFILLFLLFTNLIAFPNASLIISPPPDPDSLELAINLTDSKKEKTRLLLKLSEKLKNNDPEKALAVAEQAYKLSVENSFRDCKLQSIINLAINNWSLTNYQKAMEYAIDAEEMSTSLNSPKNLALSLYIKGIIFIEIEDYEKSASCFFKSLKISEKQHDKEAIGRVNGGIGAVYFEQKNYETALDYYFNSLKIAKKINDQIGVSRGLNNIAAVYGEMDDYQKARKYTEEALDINLKFNNLKSASINYLNLSDIFIKLKCFDKAFYNLNKAIFFYKSIDNRLFLTKAWLTMGQYYLETGEHDSSKQYALKALHNGQKYGFKKLVQSSANLLSRVYSSEEDKLKLFQYQSLEYKMKDSINAENNASDLAKLEIRHQIYKSEQEELIKQQKRDFIFLIIGLVLLSIIVLVILLLARYKIKARNIQLEKDKIMLELNSRNKEFTTNVMYLMKKNEVLSDVTEKILEIMKSSKNLETKDALRKIVKELQKCRSKDIWNEFEIRFNNVHIDFYKNLCSQYPSLTSNDLRLCAFLKLNMSSKEISEITGQRIGTLEMARSRLRKKFGISKTHVDLISFLSQF